MSPRPPLGYVNCQVDPPTLEFVISNTLPAPAIDADSLAVGAAGPTPSRLLVLSQKKLLSPETVAAPVQKVAWPVAPEPVIPPPPPLTVPLQVKLPEASTEQPVEPEPPLISTAPVESIASAFVVVLYVSAASSPVAVPICSVAGPR